MGLLHSWARALGGDVRGDQILCPGPGHSSKDRSLSVKIGRDGEPLCFSHSGDDPLACKDYARAKIGMAPFEPSGNSGRSKDQIKANGSKTYEFCDPATGKVRYRKERIESADGRKSFAFQPRGRNGSEPLLYGGERLADAGEGRPVFVVEGEKKVDRLSELGATAVSLDSGASSKWLTSHADALRGLNVVLWPDSDEAGEGYISRAAQCLHGSAASIRVVRPFGRPNGAKGRDVCDWQGNAGDLVALVDGASPYVAINPDTTEIITRRASDVNPETFSWLWKYWIARGKFHLIGGVPETGKTTITLSFAAIVSSSSTWPDGTRAPGGNVLIWTSEDDPADTLVPRLIRMGADLDRIYFIEEARLPGKKPRPFSPATDMPDLVAKAELIGNVALLVLDPVVAAIPISRDSHNNAETRNGMQPVVDFAKASNAAVVGITHLAKGSVGKDPLERLAGSLAFGALPRIVMGAAKNEMDGEDQPERLMVRIKSNIGPSGGGFGYHIDAARLYERPDIEATRIVWEHEIEGSARALLAEAESRDEDDGKAPKVAEAIIFIRSALAGGERPAMEITEEAKKTGISERTLRRAMKGTVGKRKGESGWFWRSLG
jgi:putative DNA primase/helicase